MTGGALSLVLDGLIILLLAGTIFYCVRLSTYLKAFRNSRKDLEKLIGDLSGQIEKADRAIEALRRNARDTGRDLESQISEAKGLSAELQIMTESGNNLASRLEKLADKSRAAVPAAPSALDLPRPRAKAPERKEKVQLPGFMIRDREYEEGGAEAVDEQGLMQGDFDDDEAGNLSSRAERELYEALRRKKTEAGGVS